MKNIKQTLLLLALSLVGASCSEDFVKTEFYQSVEQSPLTSSTEVLSAVRGIYSSMRSVNYLGRDYIAYAEIRSDEMSSNGRGGYFASVNGYTMTSDDNYARDTYTQIYTAVAKANIVINTDVNTITGGTAEQAKVKFYQGQAKVLRAVLFFDLLKLYGQKYTGHVDQLGIALPLVYDARALQARSSVSATEAQIEADFTQGLALMQANSTYNGTEGKVELTIDAALAYMSRYYLYKGDYASVRNYVSQLYGKYSVIPKDSYVTSWTLSNSAPNSIFELALGVQGALGTNSLATIYKGSYRNIVVRPTMYSTYATGDVRKDVIIQGASNTFRYMLNKYPNLQGTDNLKLIRYEEVLLNGVEAELNGGSAATALQYYNQILTNRGLTAATSVSMTELKAERAKELIGEGFRLWDLLRWGDTTTPLLGKTTNVNLLAFPIPRVITDLDGSLIKANPSYDNYQ
ncbi:MAG: RagB/SusD family nutrient uptake outer membrane protein [Flavobacteriaceae bacterium]|jgi:ragB/susD domain protein|nr:RagB/SusD family nutrient uptake outer membrane protein [Flavobacteriaceae bacterium]